MIFIIPGLNNRRKEGACMWFIVSRALKMSNLDMQVNFRQNLIKVCVLIIESVDSISRDGPDMPYM